MLIKSLTACVLCAASLLSAPFANADPADDAFVGALEKNGITVTDRGSATAMGQSVCDAFDQHQKPSLLAMKVAKQTGLSLRQSSYVVGVAISAYCPEYSGPTDTSTGWLNPLVPLF